MQVFLVLDLRVGHSRLQWSLVKNCSRRTDFDSFYFILLFVLEVAGCKLLSEDLSASQTYITQMKTTAQNEDNEEGDLLSIWQYSKRCVRTNLLWHVNRDNTFVLCVSILWGDPQHLTKKTEVLMASRAIPKIVLSADILHCPLLVLWVFLGDLPSITQPG